MDDLPPRYVVEHGLGQTNYILKRCYDKPCYTRYLQVESTSNADEIARQLNWADAQEGAT